ncbi:hypothetical protein SERLA73DRAFT_188741 [Serpula lacrymans var. lacrymans S7.3]|uniref:Helicase C-terminal domain-containing protein n=2 Tax=Serpula lacrymans var. lacrymans TaxID=341189 RepID=F8QC35_SERL3|nr:uncharacterized protein SERLADRAFT_479150 [Serpula lacrymans var. lacrymans S7.9]EGN94154.1 hypothetical protein SERLA73DRAFT_188741 [Serpula lacrymans var. lacrymans S7.3]EGO19583.1 hypothetical protein SERLADRAFT_479150 [Serpula lacrymans var. lacrymans S7.9]
MYHGNMAEDERRFALHEIRTNPELRVFIVSIKAGGTGLDITPCNHAIITEPWWNPYLEDQAFCRIYRPGQTRPVFVYKLVVEDSAEVNVVQTQDEK